MDYEIIIFAVCYFMSLIILAIIIMCVIVCCNRNTLIKITQNPQTEIIYEKEWKQYFIIGFVTQNNLILKTKILLSFIIFSNQNALQTIQIGENCNHDLWGFVYNPLIGVCLSYIQTFSWVLFSTFASQRYQQTILDLRSLSGWYCIIIFSIGQFFSMLLFLLNEDIQTKDQIESFFKYSLSGLIIQFGMELILQGIFLIFKAGKLAQIRINLGQS